MNDYQLCRRWGRIVPLRSVGARASGTISPPFGGHQVIISVVCRHFTVTQSHSASYQSRDKEFRTFASPRYCFTDIKFNLEMLFKLLQQKGTVSDTVRNDS